MTCGNRGRSLANDNKIFAENGSDCVPQDCRVATKMELRNCKVDSEGIGKLSIFEPSANLKQLQNVLRAK